MVAKASPANKQKTKAAGKGAPPAFGPPDLDCQVRTVHMERVLAAQESAPGQEQVQRLSRIYKALGDPGRLSILLALRGGEMCVCDLAATVGASESAMSHQLRRLRDQALVKNRRQGPVLYYSLDDEHVSELIEVGLSHLHD